MRFCCLVRAVDGQDGLLLLLVAHNRREHAPLVDPRFAAALVAIPTPRYQQMRRYTDPAVTPAVAAAMVDLLCSWPS